MEIRIKEQTTVLLLSMNLLPLLEKKNTDTQQWDSVPKTDVIRYGFQCLSISLL